MYIFMETTVLLDTEVFRIIFDGNLAKLQSEINHTGVAATCLYSKDSISISGPWDAVQSAYCSLLIQCKKANLCNDMVQASAEKKVIKSIMPLAVGGRKCIEAEQNTGPSATDALACSNCGLCFSTNYFLRKHTLHCQSSSSAGQTVSVLEPDPDDIIGAEIADSDYVQLQDMSLPVFNENEHQYYSREPEKGTENQINLGNNEIECDNIFTTVFSSGPDICTSHITEDDLNKLLSVQTGKTEFSCQKCHYIAYTIATFREHMMRRHMEYKFQCDICNKRFGPRKDLTQHKRIFHAAVKEVTCIICKKIYNNEGALQRHMAIHRRKWRCDSCSKCYITRKDLEIHQLHHIRAENTCSICKHVSPNKAVFRKHVALHRMKGELPVLNKPVKDKLSFKCSLCSRKFSNQCTLNKHEAAHIRKDLNTCNPLTCDGCDKTFVSQQTLTEHRKIHNPKTVKCPLCPKTFLNRNRLIQSHLPFHSAKRDYICSICGKGFPLKSPLVAHEKLHSDVKPYGCPHCKMTFKLHYACKRHMVNRHDYHKEDYELIHQRMLINPQGLFPKDVNLDPETSETNQCNTENADMVVDDGSTKNLLTLFEMGHVGISDTQQQRGLNEMINVDETCTDIIQTAMILANM